MKKLLLVMGILLGIGGSSLYIWMKPQTDDPYFFLSPKSLSGLDPILIPIKLYEKGASIDYAFWITPLPQQKDFYLFPASEPVTEVTLDVFNENYKKNKIGIYDVFTKNGLLDIKDRSPMFSIELYKINEDLSESILLNETKLYDASKLYNNFHILYLMKKYGYGQYRIKIAVLGNWPELNHNDFKYFIEISPRFHK